MTSCVYLSKYNNGRDASGCGKWKLGVSNYGKWKLTTWSGKWKLGLKVNAIINIYPCIIIQYCNEMWIVFMVSSNWLIHDHKRIWNSNRYTCILVKLLSEVIVFFWSNWLCWFNLKVTLNLRKVQFEPSWATVQLAIADICVKRTLVQWGQLIPASLTWNGSLWTLFIKETCPIRTVQGRHLAVLIRQVALYLVQYHRNGTCYDKCIYETHQWSHRWSFSLIPGLDLWGNLKIQ